MKHRWLSPLSVFIVAAVLLLPSFMAVEGSQTFFLHDETAPQGDGLLMDIQQPTKMTDSQRDLNAASVSWYTAPFSSSTQLFGDVQITTFIEAYFLRADLLPLQFRVVRVFLLDVGPSGVENEIDSTSATPMFFASNDTVKRKTFTINNVDYTIPINHSLGIRIEKSLDLLSFFPLSLLDRFFSTNVLFDSTTHKSSVTVPFNVTETGLTMQAYPQEQTAKPGQNATSSLEIENQGDAAETVSMSYTVTAGDQTGWGIAIEPQTVDVPAKYYAYPEVTVTPPSDATPGTYLNLSITAQGTTASASTWVNTTVAEQAYGVSVRAPGGAQGRPGTNVTYTFTIQNTGDITDTYLLSTASPGWEATLAQPTVTLPSGGSGTVDVTVTIPMDAANNSQQTLTLTATSQNDSTKQDSASVTTTAVMQGGDQDKSFWDDMGNTILFLLFIAGVIVLLVIAMLLTVYARQDVELRCDEQMQEVAPGFTATYDITVANPLEKTAGGKHSLKYTAAISGDIPDDWNVTLDKESFALDGGEETTLTLNVQTAADASLDEWASIDLTVRPKRRRSKSATLNLATLLRRPRITLSVEDVRHEPATFSEGEKVTSIVTVANTGETDADSVTVILKVNGKEKNRIEGIEIPRNREVEVRIPWVAAFGENKIDVTVRSSRDSHQ
jgi:uncharacterized membrane protein